MHGDNGLDGDGALILSIKYAAVLVDFLDFCPFLWLWRLDVFLFPRIRRLRHLALLLLLMHAMQRLMLISVQ